MQKKINSLLEAIRRERSLLLPATPIAPTIVRSTEDEPKRVRRLVVANVLPTLV